MLLVSKLMKGDKALEACLTTDSAHVLTGAVGDHVSKIHTALFAIEAVSVSPKELRTRSYGPSTAAAVLAYKTRRKIINTSYQQAADNIVGKMTIARLDAEMHLVEIAPERQPGARRNVATT